ncbi:MAG: LPS export ABC transporter ATP-binding protein [Alphaproteobacteria bacterium]|nr:LPS export ABC transporter ATP-binding protein [Alphaproteobacteria bacterium]MBQ3946120.1 LPS export ABC transporter ATP-binding protein [Alphaproteobacteria bacterium]
MILDIENIKKSYKNRMILNEVSLKFSTAEIAGILGANGAGKTTLFSILSGLIKPDDGKIKLAGKDITDTKMHKRANAGIVYLPQDTSIFRGLSVEDNIKAILEITYTDKNQMYDKLDELLEVFSITHLRKSMASVLSGGERRKVEIARALATSPAFLLMDEPFSGVDPISISEIVTIIKNLKSSGIGVIVTDHNVRETLQVIDRGYIMANGKILVSGTSDEIANNEQARKMYLGATFRI